MLRAANICLEQEVRVSASAGKIIIEPAVPAYDIDELVRGITASNRPDLLGLGGERGAEAISW